MNKLFDFTVILMVLLSREQLAVFKERIGYQFVEGWMNKKGNSPFLFQRQTWQKYSNGYSGLVVAPTGFGKTFSVFLGVVIDAFNHPQKYKKGLKVLWVSPLRSLAADLQRAMQEAVDELNIHWRVEVRNGDTPNYTRQRQVKSMPDVLIVTPETLHVLFSMKNNSRFFRYVNCIAVDEWHELIGNKRGVLTELAISYLRTINPKLKIWGITATIGNLQEAMEVLLPYPIKKVIIQSKQKKKIKIKAVLPNSLDLLPWAGHLGGKMAEQIIPIIENGNSTLIFTNTRNQAELWYQLILDVAPQFAGLVAVHHGSISKQLRNWIEESVNNGQLKAVIATSSLDLGVDFKPVDTIIQIGSVKGVARFLQRAGRSGHSPEEMSTIYFVPTHSLQLVELSALKEAVKQNKVEERFPMVQCFDVLIQFLVSWAVGEGFTELNAKQTIQNTYAFQFITDDEWTAILLFITKGGTSLSNYEEYQKVDVVDNLYKVESRRIAMLHRMNLGVIVSDVMLRVKFINGGQIGMVEEYFISKLNKGDKFILAGRVLQFVKIRDLIVYVKRAKGKAKAPSWLGGRLPLTSHLSHFLRQKIDHSLQPSSREPELKFLQPMFLHQKEYSHIPKSNELLIEKIKQNDGYHLFVYPFEGRLIHEVMASLLAYRISQLKTITFSFAMNDYGFELLSDQEIPITNENARALLGSEHLTRDIISSINATEMANRKFRDIAVISGLVHQNYYGKQKKNKGLQSSSNILFKVFEEYEPDSLLLKQAYTEVFNQQFEEVRLRKAFRRIADSKIIIQHCQQFTPLSFPIKVDSLRGSMSNEDLSARIQKMLKAQTEWKS